jgi:hypothetical protein
MSSYLGGQYSYIKLKYQIFILVYKILEINIFMAKILELNNLCFKQNNNKLNNGKYLNSIFFKHESKYFLK